MRVMPLLIVLVMLPAVAGQSYTTMDFTLESHDGTVLNARQYTPAVTPAPAILVTNGYNNDIDSATTRGFTERYAEAGYVVIAYDSRGWGQSGGNVELDGPNEVKDSMAFIDHIATMDEVIQDGEGDPRIGLLGESYAGGIQILVAGQDDRIDAIAPFTTWSNLMTSLAPNDVVQRGWVDLFFASGHATSRGIPLGPDPDAFDPDPTGGPSDKLNEWYVTMYAENGPTDEIRQEVGVVRSMTPGSIDVPTFLAQGWPDTLFPPSDALDTYYDLRSRGVDVRLAFFPGGHGGFGGYSDTEGVMEHLDGFFQQYLRDETPGLPPYPLIRYRYAQDDYVNDTQWPPSGSRNTVHYITDDGLRPAAGELGTELVVPPVPSSCTEIANFQDDTGQACGGGADGTFVTFTTEPLSNATEITGSPQVLVPFTTTLTDEVFLFSQLVDIDPDGEETSVLHQVMPVRVPAAQGSAFTEMETITHTFAAGHSIGIKIATTDVGFLGAREAGQVTLDASASPALLFLPEVPQSGFGDRTAPRILRSYSFDDVTAGLGNRTEHLRFELSDDLGLGTHAFSAQAATLNVTVTEHGIKGRTIDIIAVAEACDVASVTVRVTDLAGTTAEQSHDIVPCPPPVEPEDETPAKKKSPGPLLILPLLAAALLRRR